MSDRLSINFNATPANGLYAIIRDEADGTVWNGSAFAAWADGSIATYDVPLAAQGGDLWAADFPAAIVPGRYLVNYYESAGATPAITDLLLDSVEVYWNGTAVVPDPGVYAGRYTTETALKLFIGAENAEAYGDTDGNDIAETGAFQQAIRWGEADVDHYARGPLTATDDDYDTIVQAADANVVGAVMVQKWATVMAAKHLHHKRPLAGDTLATYKDAMIDVMREMRECAAFVTLAGVSRATSTAVNYPVVADGSEADTTCGMDCYTYPFVYGL